MSKTRLDNTSEQNILNMLMESSSISTDQMSKINTTSSEIGKTKLETALELNFTDEEKILKTLSSTYSLPSIDLSKKVIDPKIKKIIDLRYIQDNLLVPFEMSGGVLKIAIADASKLGLMKNLKTMTKMEPELFAASITDINEFINRLSKQETQKISDKNIKVEKVEKNKDELIEEKTENQQIEEASISLEEESLEAKPSVRRLSLFDTLDESSSLNESETVKPENSKSEPVFDGQLSNEEESSVENSPEDEYLPEEAQNDEFNQETEEELLDIPTFLRRQAN